MKKLVAVDLFCGAGGFSSGLVKAGFEVALSVDAWPIAVDTYKLNFDHPILCADVSKLKAKQIESYLRNRNLDLLVGGPPCQGFSIQRIGKDNDNRNNLILEFARLVIELSPKMFVMENVPGILGKRGRSLVDSFTQKLESDGYDIKIFKIDAADYGVPQHRQRVFFIGWNSKKIDSFSFPIPTHEAESKVTVSESLKGLVAVDHSSNKDPLHKRMKLSELNLKRLKMIPPGGGFENLPVEMRVNCHKDGADKIGHRNVYGRLHPDRPAVTITARFDSFTRGKFAHPIEDRNISLREGARLQSFSDSHKFIGTQEQVAALIGNAVPPRLATIISTSIAKHLKKTGRRVSQQRSGRERSKELGLI